MYPKPNNQEEKDLSHKNKINKAAQWTPCRNKARGMDWPEYQALPAFAKPADTLDALFLPDLIRTERTMFTVLQGLVNAKKPRIFLYGQSSVGEGYYTWCDLLGIQRHDYPKDKRFDLVRKYQKELDGVVLYDSETSPHYRNLACTVAGIKNLLPVEPATYELIKSKGVKLEVKVDLTGLNMTKPVEIYNYLYKTYWQDCTKRLFASLSPIGHNAYIRDLAAAAGCAVVWLDPRIPEEDVMVHKFLGDMEAGKSQIIGWWAEERSGIGAGTKHGISTIPSDFFENPTVYGGFDHVMKPPKVPKKPKLENKVYLAIFLSDGDNVQYCQHRMKVLWDDGDRGLTPLNWTVSPGLADFAPPILNYYFKTATENDFFSSGPSGMGYTLIYDEHNDKLNLNDKAKTDAYLKYSERYLAKSSIRTVTAWDGLCDMHMESFSENCRTLYGVTVEDWFQRPAPLKNICKERMAFIPNQPAYAAKIEDIYNAIAPKIEKFDGTPMFLSVQGVTWRMTPQNITALKESLDKLLPGKIEILRGDHFFTLFNEANGLPFNLCLSPDTTVTASDTTTDPALVTDGTTATLWRSDKGGEQWLQFDFGGEYKLSRYVIKHAGMDGCEKQYNNSDFTLELSLDGKVWTLCDDCRGNTASITDIDIDPTAARYARLTIKKGGRDGSVIIGEVEFYGSKVDSAVKPEKGPDYSAKLSPIPNSIEIEAAKPSANYVIDGNLSIDQFLNQIVQYVKSKI